MSYALSGALQSAIFAALAGDTDLAALDHAEIEGGPMGAARAAAALIARAFVVPGV